MYISGVVFMKVWSYNKIVVADHLCYVMNSIT